MTAPVGKRNQRRTMLRGSSRPYPETAEETGRSRSVAADRARRQLIPRYVFTRTQVSALPLRNFLLHNFWLRNFQLRNFLHSGRPPAPQRHPRVVSVTSFSFSSPMMSSSRLVTSCDILHLSLPPLWRHPIPPTPRVSHCHPPRRVPELESPLLIRLFMNFILNNSLWNIRV